MTERDRKLLCHIGRHGLSIRFVMEHIFFEGRSSANVLRRLRDRKLVVSREGLGGRMSYYQLTAGALARLSLPVSRAEPPGPQALANRLAYLWFESMAKTKRRVLEQRHVEGVFGEEARGLRGRVFCREEAESGTRMLQLYRPAPTASLPSIVRNIEAWLTSTAVWPTARQMMDRELLGYAVLVDNRAKVSAVRRKIAGLNRRATLVVEAAPSPETLMDAIAEAKEKADGLPS